MSPLTSLSRFTLACDGPSGTTQAQLFVIGSASWPVARSGGYRYSDRVLTPLPELAPMGINALGDIAGALSGFRMIATRFC